MWCRALLARICAWDFGIHGPSQWHPLAWISHQADWAIDGANAGGHHATNVALHAAAAVLLFLSIRLTQTWGPAAFTAAAFAVHPLNVESVAWISERRNVLCAVFWMAALWCYAGYTRKPSWFSYLGGPVFSAAPGIDVKTHGGDATVCSVAARCLALAAAKYG